MEKKRLEKNYGERRRARCCVVRLEKNYGSQFFAPKISDLFINSQGITKNQSAGSVFQKFTRLGRVFVEVLVQAYCERLCLYYVLKESH